MSVDVERVHDHALKPLRGRYVYADFCAGQLRSMKPKLGGARDDGAIGLPRIDSVSSFGVDAARHLYVISLNGGVWRFVRR